MTRNKIMTVFLLVLFCVNILGVTAFASSGKVVENSGSRAIQDILKDPSLAGDSVLQTKITTKFGWIFSFIITIVGFLIIVFTVMKFIFTVLYLTFPTIFDRIDSHQKTSLSIDLKNAKPTDIISYVFAIIMPNIKSLTDYADGGDGSMNVDAWSYIKKRGPAIVGFVILGCMVYDGLGRDFIAKAADVGLFVGKYIEGKDTVGYVRKFLDDGENYVYIYDESTLEGKNQKKIADAADSALRGVNDRRVTTAYYQGIGQFVSTEVVPRVSDKFLEVSGGDFDITTTKSFSIKANISESSPNNVSNVKNIEVFEVGGDIMTGVVGSKFLTVTISSLVKEEGAVSTGGGTNPVRDETGYPSSAFWNVSSAGIQIDVGATGNEITYNGTAGTTVDTTVDITYVIGDETSSRTLSRVPATVDKDFITIRPSGSGITQANLKKISFKVAIVTKIAPKSGSTNAKVWGYSSGKVFELK